MALEIPVTIYTPVDAKKDKLVVYFHGGGEDRTMKWRFESSSQSYPRLDDCQSENASNHREYAGRVGSLASLMGKEFIFTVARPSRSGYQSNIASPQNTNSRFGWMTPVK